MALELGRFLRSIPTAGWVRIGMTLVITTMSTRVAFGERATPRLVIVCNLITLAGAFVLEYKSFKARK